MVRRYKKINYAIHANPNSAILKTIQKLQAFIISKQRQNVCKLKAMQRYKRDRVSPHHQTNHVQIVTVTYRRIDVAEENDGSDNSPNGIQTIGLEPLRYHLVKTMAHTSQLRRKPVNYSIVWES